MLELALVFPWDTFWACHKLTETESHPWVALEVLPQPINVLDFHFRCGYGRQLFYEYLVSFSAHLPYLFILFVIEDGFSEPMVVSGVVLGWHVFLRLLLELLYLC